MQAAKALTSFNQARTDEGCVWQLEQLRRQIASPDFVYPGYAERKFHAYDGGNLDWQAVWEIESATASLAVRVFKDDQLAPEDALNAMRSSFTHGVQASIPHLRGLVCQGQKLPAAYTPVLW